MVFLGVQQIAKHILLLHKVTFLKDSLKVKFLWYPKYSVPDQLRFGTDPGPEP
jgi:hypothetical protein